MKIEIPAFQAMAKCNEHMNHGPITIDLGPDFTQVVRCINCKFLGFKDFNGICNGPKAIGIVQPDSYCAWGERKENTDM